MSIVLAFLGLLSAVAPQTTARTARSIEILIAGPEEARSRMDAAIRPLLATPDIRWSKGDAVPTDGVLPETEAQPGHETWQIWIDVSNPLRVRVFLPSAEARDTTTVRTVARTRAAGQDADQAAYEAIANIVTAAVADLRGKPGERGGDAALADTEPVAYVAQAPGPKAAHRHDGFYMRFQAGYGKLTATEGNDSLDYSKLGPTLSVAMGGALVPNLVLYAELMMTAVANTVDRVDSSSGSFTRHTSDDIVLSVFGPGVGYFLMPVNVYLSATLGFAKLTFLDAYTDSPVADTGLGYAASFTVGKEWWNGPEWGVGIAARLSYAGWMKHKYDRGRWFMYGGYVDSTMHATAVSLLLSTTYN